MNEKPRSADESILTKDFLGKVGLEGLVIGAMIGFLTGYHQNGALLGSTYAFVSLPIIQFLKWVRVKLRKMENNNGFK